MFVDSHGWIATGIHLNEIVEEKSFSSFKFGDGNTVLSTKAVTIPATVGK